MAENSDLERGGDEISGAPDEESYDAAPRRSRGNLWPLYLVVGCVGLCGLCCFLPFCLLAVTGVSLAAVFSNSETTQASTQTFTVDPDTPVQLTVDGMSGAINVRAGTNSDEVIVTTTKKAYGWTKSAAQKELDNIKVDIQQPATGQIDITVNSDRRENSFWFLANQVDLTITVPEDVYLTLQNNTGSIDISGVRVRSMDVQSNTGSVTFDGQIGVDPRQTFSIQTNTGSITVRLPADVNTKLDAQADVGSVTVSNRFDHMADVSDNHAGVGEMWTGTLGSSAEALPTLRLHTNTGSVSVSVH
jgi:hypothetical protein